MAMSDKEFDALLEKESNVSKSRNKVSTVEAKENQPAKQETLNPDRLQGDEQLKSEGDFVIAGQEQHEDFKNVSKIWTDQCISWDELQNQLEESSQHNKDILVEPNQLSLKRESEETAKPVLIVDHDELGGEYEFSPNSFDQFAGPNFCSIGSRLVDVPRDKYEADRTYEIYSHRFESVIAKRAKAEKKVFLRLRSNGSASVRAMLSERYAVIDHRWVAETVKGMLPDGLVSHFDRERFAETGGDYVRYNVLIPDSIRAEKDSDYGGMESVSNSEIGTGRQSILPSIFRAICMNGCIWGARSDKRFAVSKKHLGTNVDYEYLAFQIRQSLTAAIPLVGEGINMLLDSQKLVNDKTDFMHLLGYVGKVELSLTKEERKRLFGTMEKEDMPNSAFGLVNSVTRFAQDEHNSLYQQQDIEETIGRLLGKWNAKPNEFELLCENAVSFDVGKELG